LFEPLAIDNKRSDQRERKSQANAPHIYLPKGSRGDYRLFEPLAIDNKRSDQRERKSQANAPHIYLPKGSRGDCHSFEPLLTAFLDILTNNSTELQVIQELAKKYA
jgi:hypothetical protein